MKRLTYKDLIVALGVLVAAVIILTTVYFRGAGTATRSVKVVPEKKMKPAAILELVGKKFSSHIWL